MQILLANFGIPSESLTWFLLGVIGAVGILAMLSPKRFSMLASRGGQWVDSSKLLAQLDKRVDIDAYVLPYSRLLGVAVLAATALIGYLVVKH